MKAIFPILLCLAANHLASGQEIDDSSALSEKVQKAILEFNRRQNAGEEPANEVVVNLPPPEAASELEEETPPAAIPVEETETGDEPPATAEPTLVTGKPPAAEPEEQPAETETEISLEEPTELAGSAGPLEAAPAEPEGLGIRIEPIRDGKGSTATGQIKLKANFPAKALSTTPDGWILEKSPQAPAFLEEVTLRPGKTISLSISPHVLVPAADGVNTFAVVEPGFDSSEGYRQSNTVSAILGNSVAQLDRDSILLGNAISDLHQLLASLPKPEPEPEEPDQP